MESVVRARRTSLMSACLFAQSVTRGEKRSSYLRSSFMVLKMSCGSVRDSFAWMLVVVGILLALVIACWVLFRR